MEIRLAGLEPESIVDGPGYRFTVFVQGCPHNCPGCHNPQTHDFSGGHLADTDDVIAYLGKNPLVRGLTLSGGEPMMQPEPLYLIAQGGEGKGHERLVLHGLHAGGAAAGEPRGSHEAALCRRCAGGRAVPLA